KKTLAQLESFDYGQPDPGDTRLVKTCIRLTRVPLEKLTLGDLRVLIGQSFGLPFLIPLAVERLEPDPLVEADLYPGDLLANILEAEDYDWRKNGTCETASANWLSVPWRPSPQTPRITLRSLRES